MPANADLGTASVRTDSNPVEMLVAGCAPAVGRRRRFRHALRNQGRAAHQDCGNFIF